MVPCYFGFVRYGFIRAVCMRQSDEGRRYHSSGEKGGVGIIMHARHVTHDFVLSDIPRRYVALVIASYR